MNDLKWFDTLTQPGGPNEERQPVPSAQLRIVYPPELAELPPIEVAALPVVLGRSAGRGATHMVGHGTVSRSHFSIRYEPLSQVHVGSDLGSHNGSRLDGVQVDRTEQLLNDGSVLRIGAVVLVYERRPDSVEPSAGAASAGDTNLRGSSPAMIHLRAAVERAATDRSPVLLIGDTGTGKEWIGRELHRLSGRKGPLVCVNCAELTASLVESQLFGHKRGAFTGALDASPGLFRSAEGGTLFLDEIGELPLELQPKLLRVLEESVVRPVGSTATFDVDVRVVAATNRDLSEMVEERTFRRDLRARLSLWELQAPPLTDRRSDLLMWASVLTEQWASSRGFAAFSFKCDSDAAEQMLLHDWPDNLRGVNRLVHRFADVLRDGHELSLRDVATVVPAKVAAAKPSVAEAQTFDSERTDRVSTLRRRKSNVTGLPRPAPPPDELEKMLHKLGSVRATAKYYGRDRKQIYRWIKRFEIVWNG